MLEEGKIKYNYEPKFQVVAQESMRRLKWGKIKENKKTGQ